ncbi:WcaF family extracellular polysaccharide biosynthesis acetyltransferase [Pontibacter sp. SGAir0037]|uniref:WcaF family extracellular polysaccharide biosynthesis acetyltransferase n=1 Tax=Pontibacter sp. SGAir0037 TaxID=2571030 RepID=UPI0010CCD589|nr:WcaF family extracellular polysaccharide biosynthesis acetyltransferase [Pontibacter sp. SGAir0037]QCR22158.1 colanic acid biosynthesis acetyltransferase WcaF [Pontibacter sp. SGAir0037]
MQATQNKVSLRSYNNSWYKPGGNALKRTCWYFVNIFFFLNPLNPFSKLKVWLLRLFGASVGQEVVLKPGIRIKYPWLLEIGSYVWIGENVWIDNLVQVRIADNVVLSQGAMLLTGSHDYKKKGFDLLVGAIDIQEGVWIGAKALVCPGVSCGSHSVLAAGSVATTAMEPYTVYQGNPATAKRTRTILA